jgi:hypothetical protein
MGHDPPTLPSAFFSLKTGKKNSVHFGNAGRRVIFNPEENCFSDRNFPSALSFAGFLIWHASCSKQGIRRKTPTQHAR